MQDFILIQPPLKVSFKRWVSTDKTTLESVTMSVEEFPNFFVQQISTLRSHHFIAREQQAAVRKRKEELRDGEVLLGGDFAENYSSILQDEAQGYHWNKEQTTLHPFVAYFKQNNEVKCISAVIISDCLKHNTLAFHAFKRRMIQYLRDEGICVNRISYYSDGSGAQYKVCRESTNTKY